MALTVLSRPLPGYLAVGNPILYKFQRKDYTSASVANSSGKIQIVVNGIDLTTIFTVGSKGWFVSDNGIYNLAVSVFSVSFSTNTTITFNESFTSSATTGYVNTYSRLSYKVEVSLFDSVSNADLTGLTFGYSPDKTGLIKADISAIIKTLISPEIPTFFISPDILTIFLQTYTSDQSIKSFYIKYREKWIGSANSLTSDSAQIMNVLYGSNQIGSINNVVRQQSPIGGLESIFTRSINSFSFINSNVANLFLRLTGKFITYYILIDQYTGMKNYFWYGNILNFYEELVDGNVAWSFANTKTAANISLTTGQYSRVLRTIIVCKAKSFLELQITVTPTTNVYFAVRVFMFNSAGTLLNSNSDTNTKFEFTPNGDGLPVSVTKKLAATVSVSDATYIQFQVEGLNGAGVSGVQSFGMTANINNILDDLSVDVISKASYNASETLIYSQPYKAYAICEMKNKFNLIWRNLQGGISSFTFQFSQDYFFTYSKNKARQYVLYAENLSKEQIDSLEELNTLGEIYTSPYDEISPSVISTSKRIGAQVYKVNDDATLTGVVVIPTSNKFKTQSVKNRITITVEMPEVISI